MLSQDTITQLENKHQANRRTIVREYFQHMFLSYFYQNKHAKHIYFKGGTALRVIYQSPRFSEDLDFSTTLTTKALIEDVVVETIGAFATEGIGTDIEEAKSTTGGYLAILNFMAYDMTVPIRLEVSARKARQSESSVATVANDYIPDYTVVQLAETQLVAEKVTALLSRKKPRDFYDFYFMMRHGMITNKNTDILSSVRQLLHKSNLRFDAELKEYLPKSHHMITRDFKSTLEREIKRYI